MQQRHIQLIAEDLKGLKTALKNQAKQQMIFGMAKLVLSFVGAGALAELASNASFLADLSDVTVVGAEILGIPQEKALALLKQGIEYFQDEDNRKQLVSVATARFLKMVGFEEPDQFVMLWAETSLALTSPAQFSTKEKQPVLKSLEESLMLDANPTITETSLKSELTSIPAKNSPVQPELLPHPTKYLRGEQSPAELCTTQSSIFTTSLKLTSVVPNVSTVSDSFSTWLKQIQTQGHFSLSVSDKNVCIQFSSQQKTLEEIEAILFDLNDHLKTLPELQRIEVEDRDVEDNCLIITTKTKLDAKKFNMVLTKQYGLEVASPASRLTLVK